MTLNNGKLLTLDDLRARQKTLNERMEKQKLEMIDNLSTIRENLQPMKILKETAEELFDGSPQSNSTLQLGLTNGVSTFADYFVKDPRTSMIVKWLIPAAIKMAPQAANWAGDNIPDKNDLLRFAHRSITTLRTKLNAK